MTETGERGIGREGEPRRVHPAIERLAAYAWRFIVIAIALYGVLWLLWQVRLIVFPLIVALLLAVALNVPARWLRSKGWPKALAAWAAMLAFLGLLGLAGALIVPAMVDEFADLGTTIEEGVDDVEDWLVDESPFDVSRADIEDFREEARDIVSRSLRSNAGTIVSGVVVFEVIAGVLLALVIAFFFVKDGEQIQEWALSHLPAQRRELTRRLAARAWTTLAGYLRGSAMLGIVEGITIGLALFLAGGGLAVPVAVLTFFAAFVPFVGAIVAGVIAVLVALATAGFTPALIVAGVALVVQQLDNDLLAPVVFGHTLRLHPVVILVAVTAGGALLGLAGAFIAVPLTAVVINVLGEYRDALAE
ncbi:MAG TPA: AI-2E family transporter [Acidimicrobiia bacterium]|nr:AI-2E family transporter [Acidimicrobiia bacterium]